MSSVLITGANRGIGLALAAVYVDQGRRVIACCRDLEQAAELQRIGTRGDLSLYPLEVTDAAAVTALSAELAGETIDVLINNAGVYGPRVGFGHIDYDAWRQVLEVNTLAPLRIAEAFVSQLARSGRGVLAMITSKMGSIADNTSGGSYIYRSSKAALNAVTRSLAYDLASRNISCAVIHPGWVRTDMGGPSGLISPRRSAEGIAGVIARLGPADSGSFYNYDGSPIPW